ncbi:MAG: endonuclease V [Phycisphaerae bacterium]
MASEIVERWREEQAAVRRRVVVAPLVTLPRFVAGADCAFSDDKAWVFAVAVVWDREAKQLVETRSVMLRVTVPYIPGYLAFREGPAVYMALATLEHPFGAAMFDAHGHAHPRRCGLATFVGVQRNVPAVGVAKSRLVGEHAEPAPEAGSDTPLTDAGETLGLVLRTRANVKPVYVSVGHRVDLPSARALVLACCTRYRLPEPTRQADRLCAEAKGRR